MNADPCQGVVSMAENCRFSFADQKGAALVVALIMMVVLTVIGLASTLNSTFENKLSGNKRASTDCFYAADAGIQAVLGTITNFNTSTYTLVPNTGTLPSDLWGLSINSIRTSPSLDLPSGVSFNTPPDVGIYHQNPEKVTGAPRGSGFSAVGNYEFEYYIIDSAGCDQMDISLLATNCTHRERVVRLLPTTVGGN